MADDRHRDFDQVGTTPVWAAGHLLAGRYHLESLVGRGAMGVVWRARDEQMGGRTVAIKAQPQAVRHDPQGLKQLRAEAAHTIDLHHPGIVSVNHLEASDDNVFLVMQYVSGVSLARRLADEGPLPPMQVIELAERLCDALAYAHAEGVIHRDIKPGNVLLTDSGAPKLADFGIARSVRDTMHRLSRLGTVGTLPYMAPEQIRGKELTPRTDLYQLSATLYECLAGHPPFHEGVLEWQIVNEPAPPLEGVPEPLASVVMAGLAKDPAARPADAEAFKRLLYAAPSAVIPTPRAVTPAPAIIAPAKTVRDEGPDASEMIVIPAGEFWMGSSDDAGDARDQEKPRHQVFLDAFEIDKHPLTNARWKRFTDARGYGERRWWSEEGWRWREQQKITQPGYWSDKQFNEPEQPVVGVSWYEAEAFCAWAGKRLPTEAEWEKAARGADGRRYPWGNEWDKARANSHESGIGRPTPVGKYPSGASPYGVHDMAGNVWEWVADWYGGDYYKQSPDRNPRGPDTGTRKVLRGGSFFLNPIHLRAAHRFVNSPDYRFRSIGCRCARGLP